jgi:hypothetical protein
LRTKCLIKHFTEGKIKGGEGGRRRCKQLLEDGKEKGLFWKLKYEATDRQLWRIRFGRDYGPTSLNTDNRKNVS